jgi:quercetin dioxygenase-like cupin family protein
MNTRTWVALLLCLTAHKSFAQPAPLCVENSPERRGEIGCSVIVQKLLPEGLKEPIFWHIDRFPTLAQARAAEGPASVAFEAGGKSWLLGVESKTSDHHGGEHVAQVGPLPLVPASRYSIQINSALFPPGMYSLAHTHSGVEGFYVVEGEQCLQTPTESVILKKGESLVIPAGVPMRLVAAGTSMRLGFGVIVYDASKPSTMRIAEQNAPKLVACESAARPRSPR